MGYVTTNPPGARSKNPSALNDKSSALSTRTSRDCCVDEQIQHTYLSFENNTPIPELTKTSAHEIDAGKRPFHCHWQTQTEIKMIILMKRLSLLLSSIPVMLLIVMTSSIHILF